MLLATGLKEKQAYPRVNRAPNLSVHRSRSILIPASPWPTCEAAVELACPECLGNEVGMMPATLVFTTERYVWRLPRFPGARHTPLETLLISKLHQGIHSEPTVSNKGLYTPDLCGIIHVVSSAHPLVDGETRCGLGENRLRHLNT